MENISNFLQLTILLIDHHLIKKAASIKNETA